MTRCNLIVLGGGEDQVPAYREARRLGFRVIGVDQRPDCLGAQEADLFLCETTRDAPAIARALGPIHVAGVISPGSDAAQESVAQLSRIYGTGHQPSPSSLRCTVDKGAFRTVLDLVGLPSCRYAQHEDTAELVKRANALSYPLVVKPADSSGSKGLSVVNSVAGLEAAIDHARSFSFTGQVIAEELLYGRHGSVEGFFCDGRLEFMAVTERCLTEPPYFISLAHLVPASFGAEVTDVLRQMVTTVCEHLEHRHGPINLDFVVAPNGNVHLIEMGARLGGNGLPLLALHAFGINTVEAALCVVTGQPFEIRPTRERLAMLQIITAQVAGVLLDVRGLEAACRIKGVVDLQFFKQPGDAVKPYTQAAHKLGYLLVVGDDRAGLIRTRDAAMRALELTIGTPGFEAVQ